MGGFVQKDLLGRGHAIRYLSREVSGGYLPRGASGRDCAFFTIGRLPSRYPVFPYPTRSLSEVIMKYFSHISITLCSGSFFAIDANAVNLFLLCPSIKMPHRYGRRIHWSTSHSPPSLSIHALFACSLPATPWPPSTLIHSHPHAPIPNIEVLLQPIVERCLHFNPVFCPLLCLLIMLLHKMIHHRCPDCVCARELKILQRRMFDSNSFL